MTDAEASVSAYPAGYTVHVVYRKQISDGNYGSETSELSFEGVARIRSAEDLARDLLKLARELVLDQLRASPSVAIRRALEHEAPMDDPDEDSF
jgi:hypothetical protein